MNLTGGVNIKYKASEVEVYTSDYNEKAEEEKLIEYFENAGLHDDSMEFLLQFNSPNPEYMISIYNSNLVEIVNYIREKGQTKEAFNDLYKFSNEGREIPFEFDSDIMIDHKRYEDEMIDVELTKSEGIKIEGKECSNCGHDRFVVWTEQRRGNDENQTLLIECSGCTTRQHF